MRMGATGETGGKVVGEVVRGGCMRVTGHLINPDPRSDAVDSALRMGACE